MKRVQHLIIFTFIPILLCSCGEPSPDAVKTVVKDEDILVSYKDVVLSWETNTFEHGGNVINIPETWKVGITTQKRETFEKLDPHDITFQYHYKEIITYGGDTKIETKFNDLDEEKPNKKDKIFEISVVGLDIDSKITVKDELINDCYFKYDTNAEFYNFCYFKIAKNDVNQLKAGYFNQINVRLDYLEHYDEAVSFKTREDDGFNDVGYYSEVAIVHNPNL